MDDLSATLVGIPAHRPEAAAPSAPPPAEGLRTWTLDALARRDPDAERDASVEASELARALAAQAVALASDADTGEYQERLRTLERGLWPEKPLSGYALLSSLGAFLVARVAMSWAPPTGTKLRDTPLDRDGLLIALRDLGVDGRTAQAITGDWTGPDPEVRAEPSGLDAARIAALAEGTLSRRERARALTQVAHSPRCLARLATTALALARARVVMPALPARTVELGPGYVPGVAALLLGRPDRALDLLGYSPDQPALRAVVELAKAQWAFSRGESPILPDDPSLVLPPVDEPRSDHVRSSPPPVPPADSDGEDDVLEIVEERVATGAVSPIDPTADDRRTPRTPEWARVELGRNFDQEFLGHWKNARRASASVLARNGQLLGILPGQPPRSVPRRSLPPDPRVLVALIERAGLAADEESSNAQHTDRIEIADIFRGGQSVMSSPEPIFAMARSALRTVVLSAEGHAPSLAAVETAGDLDWVLRRCRALALGARGELDAAMAALAGIETSFCPEARWLEMRLLRYQGRAAEPAPVSEVRELAGQLVTDLTHALARTVAGTV